MSTNKLSMFAYTVNKEYNNAWIEHYSDYQSHEALLSLRSNDIIYELIKYDFPVHFHALRSIIFGKFSGWASMKKKKHYIQRQQSLVNHFCALIRVRNPHFLIDWAMMGTTSMSAKGMQTNIYRSSALKSFSCTLKTAFRHLDAIHASTANERNAIIVEQQCMHHALDNTQQ